MQTNTWDWKTGGGVSSAGSKDIGKMPMLQFFKPIRQGGFINGAIGDP